MTAIGRVEPTTGPLPTASCRWDQETEILSVNLDGVEGPGGFAGTVELEDAGGVYVTLDFHEGALRGLEIVVWPSSTTVEALAAPSPSQQGRVTVPPRQSQPDVALVEVEVPLAVERNADETVVHLRIGPKRQVQAVAVADNVMAERDASGELAGVWLVNVPPFPATEADG